MQSKNLNSQQYLQRCIGLGIILWGMVLPLFAQSPAATYQSLFEDFAKREAIAYTMDIAIYQPMDAEVATHQSKVVVWKKGSQTYMQLEEYAVYQDAQQAIYIDHVDKSIMVHPIKEAINTTYIDWETTLAWLDYLALEGVEQALTDTTALLRFANIQSKTSVEVVYAPQSGLLHRITNTMDLSAVEEVQYELDQSKIEVLFSAYNLKPDSLPDAASQLLRRAKTKRGGTATYADYKVVNY